MSDVLAILRDPYFQVTYLFVTGVAAIYCLIGLWSAVSRRHWFVRAIVPGLALAALIPIRAHEPLLFYAMIMGEIVATMTLSRWWRTVAPVRRAGIEHSCDTDPRSRSASGTYQRFRFGLRDLFLLMIVAGVIAWIVTGFAGVGLLIQWPGAIVASLLLAALTLCAWNVFTARRRGLALGLLVSMLAAAVTVEVTLLGNWLQISDFLITTKSLQLWRHYSGIFSLLYGEFTGLLLIALGLRRLAHGDSTPRIARRASQLTIAVVFVVAAIPLLTLYWRMTGVPDFPPPVKMPENVFPMVIERGAPMEMSGPTRARAIYQELLPLLDRPGHVSLDLLQPISDPFEHDRYWKDTRSIGRAIDAEATVLENAGKFDEAAERSLSILKVAQMLSRGGITLDILVGRAVEGVGRHRLIRLRTKISPEMRAKVFALTRAIEAGREPIQVIEQRDAAFNCRTMRWRYSFERQIPFQLFGLERTGYNDTHLMDFPHRQEAGCWLLITDLAIRLFHEDHSRLPRTLEELVPEYLADVPVDPYSDQPLVYRPADGEFVLYSVGPDGRDNLGERAKSGQNVYQTPNIDWDLNSLVAP